MNTPVSASTPIGAISPTDQCSLVGRRTTATLRR
jgi:hypothetical protein